MPHICLILLIYLPHTWSYLFNTAYTCPIPGHTCSILLIPAPCMVTSCHTSPILGHTCPYLPHTCLVLLIPGCTWPYLFNTAHTYLIYLVMIIPAQYCSYLHHTWSYQSHTQSYLPSPASYLVQYCSCLVVPGHTCPILLEFSRCSQSANSIYVHQET